MMAQLKTPRRCVNTYGATVNCKELIGMSKRTCSIEGCDRPLQARGWCGTHYARWHRHGDPEWTPPTLTCSAGDCGRDVYGRGLCNMHWQRWRTHGDPLAGGRRYLSPHDAFKARTIRDESGCLLWTGALSAAGYGQIPVGNDRHLAHRWAWERVNGTIPDDKVIDHICRQPQCVEVAHMRLATRAQNVWYQKPHPNKSGLPQHVRKEGRKFSVQIIRNKKMHRFGPFTTLEEATQVAVQKNAELSGEFTFPPEDHLVGVQLGGVA